MLINIIKYLIFGLIQGFTEPLPISSSGHLVLFRYLFNTNAFDDLTFEVFLNFASFLAIFYIFRQDILKLIKSFFSYIFNKEKRLNKEICNNFKYALLIIIGSIPAVIGGLLFKDLIETKFSNIKILGIAFLITSILLFIIRNSIGFKKEHEITYIDAIIIGLFQMAALLPGISRSGAVLVGALLMSLERNNALKYSFMLYLPVSIGSFILSIPDLIHISSELIVPYLFGFIICMITTYFASLWFFNIVRKNRLISFSIYLLILGLIIIIFI